jgi:hypothetical protein
MTAEYAGYFLATLASPNWNSIIWNIASGAVDLAVSRIKSGLAFPASIALTLVDAIRLIYNICQTIYQGQLYSNIRSATNAYADAHGTMVCATGVLMTTYYTSGNAFPNWTYETWQGGMMYGELGYDDGAFKLNG